MVSREETSKSVRVERAGPVTTIIVSRPEVRNAIDRATALALADTFREFEADADARVAVLHGDHGTFCAGADLKAAARGELPRIEPTGDGPLGPTRMVLNKPVIASIAGHAVAGGLELALLCDLRVAEEDAVLGVFCRRWGVPLIDGGTVRLPRLIGMSRALDLILTGRPVSAAEAMGMGLVNRVVPQGHARAESEALAQEIAAFPQTCMLHDRRSVYEGFNLPFEEAMASEFCRGTASLQEAGPGIARFVGGAGRHGGFDDA